MYIYTHIYIKEILKKSIPWEPIATLASLCFAFDRGLLNSFCGIVVLLPELPLYYMYYDLSIVAKPWELIILIISLVFFSLLKQNI